MTAPDILKIQECSLIQIQERLKQFARRYGLIIFNWMKTVPHCVHVWL